MRKQRILYVFLLAALLLSARTSQAQVLDLSSRSARPSREWVRDAVIYQIFPRQYSARGDFNSITADLDRLETLGVNVLWLMPVHPIGVEKKKGSIGSPYAVRDYYGVNPDYGTPADLKRLIAESHKRGIRVIIDIVANHTSWDNTLIRTHPEFYKKDKNGNIVPPVADWADVAGLDHSNPALRRYLVDMLKFWVREYGVDGFRCDVAMMVPTDLWEHARAEVNKIKSDTIWLAEAEKPELLLTAFDLDYSWELFHAIDRAVQGRGPVSDIRMVWEKQASMYPRKAVRMRFSDNHDERRAIARLGEHGALAAQLLVLTLDGVPLIYNGMEVGDTTESGFPALFEKLPIFWPIAVRRPAFERFYKEMLRLRRSSPALRQGELKWLDTSERSRVVAFSRHHKDEELVIVLNLSNTTLRGDIKVSGDFEDITPEFEEHNAVIRGKQDQRTISAFPGFSLNAFEGRIFRRGPKKRT